MSYDDFSDFEIGTVKELLLDFGMIRFVKFSKYQFFVEVSLKNVDPFVYSHFTQVLFTIEASALFDKYVKVDK